MSQHIGCAAEATAEQVLEALERIAARRRRDAPAPDTSLVGGDPGRSTQLVDGPRHSGRPLGALLVPRGFVTDKELQDALAVQRQSGERLGEILVRLGHIRADDLVELLAEQFRLPTIDLTRTKFDATVAGLISSEEAHSCGALPIRRDGDCIDVAIVDPTDDATVQLLARRLNAPIRLHLATLAAVDAALATLTVDVAGCRNV